MVLCTFTGYISIVDAGLDRPVIVAQLVCTSEYIRIYPGICSIEFLAYHPYDHMYTGDRFPYIGAFDEH